MSDESEKSFSFEAAMEFFQPKIDAIKKRIEENGYPCNWLDQVPDTSGSCNLFLPRGKMKSGITTYRSKCPYYTGRWLCGGFTAVDCALVEQLLPGIVGDIACTKDHENCPLKINQGTNHEKRSQTDSL